MDDIEWIKQDQAHQLQMAEIEARKAWREREALTTRIGYIATAIGIIGVTAIFAWLILSWVKDSGERGKELEQTCIAAGGTWTQFGGSTGKMCVYLDKVEQ